MGALLADSSVALGIDLTGSLPQYVALPEASSVPEW